MEQNIETLKYELRYVWDGEKLLVTSKYMWDHELFTSKSAMFTNCNEHNEVHYVAVKHGFWPFCKFEWQNFTFAQSYSQRKGTRQGVTPVIFLSPPKFKMRHIENKVHIIFVYLL